MFVGIGLKGLEEGRRGVYEEHALPPACRHGGRDREGGWRGKRGGGRKSVGSGRTRFCWCDSLPFGATLQTRGEYVGSHLSFKTIITVLVTLSSAATLRFAHRRRRRTLIVKYFLDNRIAAPRVTSRPRVGTTYLLLFELRQNSSRIPFVCRNPLKELCFRQSVVPQVDTMCKPRVECSRLEHEHTVTPPRVPF